MTEQVPNPVDVTVRNWTLDGAFDDQIADNLNFGLEEDVLAVIQSILTGLCILLVTDIVFRLVVRADSVHMDSFSTYRRFLFLRCANPIEWLSLVSAGGDGRPSDNAAAECRPDRDATKGFPRLQALGVGLVGILLVFMQLLFIFLATSSSRTVQIDKARVPAIVVADPGDTSIAWIGDDICQRQPLVTQPGFKSVASVMLCMYSVGHRINVQGMTNATAILRMWMRDGHISLQITYENFTRTSEHFIAISLSNGTDYHSISSATVVDVRSVLPAVLKRHSVGVLVNESRIDPSAAQKNTWDEVFLLDVSSVQIPERILQEDVNWSDPSKKVRFYLRSIVQGTLSLSGRSRAQKYLQKGTFLDQFGGPLVTATRPRISLVVCIAMTCGIFLLWGVLLCGSSWHCGIDERAVWIHMFETIEFVEDYKEKPEENIFIE